MTASDVRSELERIWAEVVGPVTGDGDNFFDLGGDSLAGMELVSRVYDRFQVELPFWALFDHPTIDDLARVVEEARTTVVSAPVRTLDETRLPLSTIQRQLWFEQRVHARRVVPQVIRAYQLKGHINVAALRWALAEVVRRHEPLRTAFPEVDGEPIAVVTEPEPLAFEVIDLERCPASLHGDRSRAAHKSLVGRELDLERGPLYCVGLIRHRPTVHELVIGFNEMVGDGISMDIVLGELSVLYDARVRGQPSPLPDLDVRYRDVAIWQESEAYQRALERDFDYWRDKLAGVPLTLAFPPTAVPRLRPVPRRTSVVEERLSRALSARIRDVAGDLGVSPVVIYVAALKIVLYIVTGVLDLVVVSPVANRDRTELAPLIGPLFTNLYLRTDLSGDPTLGEVLDREWQTVRDGFAHAKVPSGRIVDWLRGGVPAGLEPSFAVRFRHGSRRRTRQPQFPGVRVEHVDVLPAEHFALWVDEDPGRPTTLAFCCDADVFAKATIRTLHAHARTVLEALTSNPQMRISELTSTDAGRRETPAPKRSRPVEPRACVPALVAAQAARTPDAVAISTTTTDVSYRDLDAGANRVAHLLRSRGVRRGIAVGVMLDPSARTVIAMLGVLKAGGTCVPVTQPDLQSPPSAWTGQAGVRLLVSTHFVEAASHLGWTHIDLDLERHAIAAMDATSPASESTPGDAALVIPGGGSTVPVQGSIVSHQNLVDQALWCQRTQRLTESDRVFHVPDSGVRTWALALWPALVSGAAFVVPDHQSTRVSVVDWLADRKVTVACLTVTLVRQMLAGDQVTGPQPRLVVVIDATSTFDRAVVADRFALCGHYVVAAAGGVVARLNVTADKAGVAPTFGETVGDYRIKVLATHGRPASADAVGTIHVVRNARAADGADRPALPRTHLDPVLLETGDIGRRRSDGAVELLGRANDEVLIRGYRLTPTASYLERLLVSHPKVARAAVGAVTCPDGDYLTGCLVLRPDAVVEPVELNRWLASRAHLVVRPNAYVAVDDFPYRSDGSLDRKLLFQLITDAVAAADEDPTPPGTETERLLLGIWSEVLARDVTVSSDFYYVGGDVTHLPRLLRRTELYALPLTMEDLVTVRTIAELAELVDHRRATTEVTDA